MKLLNSFGPNPRAVRMALIEKGIDIEFVEHDILGGENRSEAYSKKNPGAQMPALELDDGTVFGETTTICEYLDEKHPIPTLIGATAEERANTRQWIRRVELGITEHMYNGFRYAEGIDLFRDRMVVIPEAADGLKAKAADARKWLDGQIGGRDFIAGDKLTFADIILFCCTDFAKGVGQPIESNLENLTAWSDRMGARPSAKASLHPAAEQVNMQG
ncbi:MAG TPA: glutathione S-transferase [Gammaproteobacteria bacterium]|nr:glutathione S-transferase [Gammaproteobacteria bacterium]